MLPGATHTRSDRESVKGRLGGRTQEISRLVGRSLRACIDLKALGENTIAIDCDVLQADGGTRTAAITGAYVALSDAVTYLAAAGKLSDPKPLSCAIAAVSVGVVDGRVRVDLPYEEDSRAEVDMNVVATDTGTLVEIQGTGEGATFPRSTLDKMLDAALAACETLFTVQREALELPYPGVLPGGAGRQEGVRLLTTPCWSPAATARSWPNCTGSSTPPASRGSRWSPSTTCRPSTRHPKPAPRSRRTRWPRRVTATPPPGCRRVADDSGLEVAALNGMPGVLSARWSGTHGDDVANYALLLAQMRDVPDERRGRRRSCRPARWSTVPAPTTARWCAASGPA